MVHPDNEYLQIAGNRVGCTNRAKALHYGFSQHQRRSGDAFMLVLIT
jgi:hypothetical protein